ncbi:hypothetical protein RIF25_04040 [Thermosynechococcaceae cyanobacterium BACA0444]|uniref:Uncharacterized protein n=1 Tax=Pseudocalidococcus azoricus BACA0444 TaxID=2918990 RepID=A0AAE4FQQ8_9CYAN|nr:hypothetical protein [Pseudocalidococcus azoricus]MDS3859974.1 hypothetical protein [Pseudocalidococcus azoricus BACA0444]
MTRLDEITTRRLALIRYLYTVAVSQSLQPEPLSGISILTFHDAAELFLQLGTEFLNAGEGNNNISFMKYWELIDPKLGAEKLQQKVSMHRMNKARVAFKHHGTLPSRHDIEAFRSTVSNFFEDNTPLIFRIEFKEVSLLQLVNCEKTKNNLIEAQSHRDSGNFDKALSDISLAFAYLIDDYEARKRNWYGQSPFFFGQDMKSASSSKMQLKSGSPHASFVDKTNKSITAMRSALKILSLGLDYRRYIRFKLLTPYLTYTMSGEYLHSQLQRTHKLTDQDVQYCYDFVIESALKLQEFDFDVENQGAL